MEHFLIYHDDLDIVSVIEHLKTEDWIRTYFDASLEDIYNPGNYAFNIAEGCKYILIPDRNFFSYINSSVRNTNSEQKYKTAIALVLFCQFCEIEIEPNLSLYELINHDSNNIAHAAQELELFNAINNSPQKPLYDYFSGKISQIPFPKVEYINREKLKEQMMQYNWLEEWLSLYLMSLKIVDLSLSGNSGIKNLKDLIVWMVNDFRRSHVVIMFSIFLFTTLRESKMIKYRAKDDKELRRLSIKNMAWDFYYMNTFIRKLQNKPHDTEYIFATNDKVIRKVLTLAYKVARAQNITPFMEMLKPKEYNQLQTIYSITNQTTNRKYDTDDWTPEYRKKLINELENKLLV